MDKSIIVSESREQRAESREQRAESREQRAESRSYYFDFLRVFAAFAVMVLHVAAQNWYTTDIHTFEWQAMNFYDAIVRWSVPIFVMISGALFLNRDIPIKKIYGKYIFRIFTAFVFWSFMYAAIDFVKSGKILGFAGEFLRGHYHMWFLSMIVGLYALQPFLKKIAASESLTKYFLLLVFVFTLLLPETVEIISLFSEKYGKFADTMANRFQLHFVAGLTGYFLLGYFLNNIKVSPKTERIIYISGLLGFTATVMMSLYASHFKGEPFVFYGNNTVNVMCEAAAVFVFFRAKLNFPTRFIRSLSKYSFGAYLVHVLVIRLIRRIGLNTLTFSPAISIPVISVIVFVISFAISAVLNHIPVLKKYIV